MHCVHREGSTATTREGSEVYQSPGQLSLPATACGEPDSKTLFIKSHTSDLCH